MLSQPMKLSSRLFLPGLFTAVILLLGALTLAGANGALRAFGDLYLIHYDLPPFGDAYGITSAMACERQGIETYISNPCHYKPDLGFVYPPVWKLLALLPIDAGWTTGFALAFIACFAIALYFLPTSPSRRGQVLAGLAAVSPATVMAANYGNNDLLLFAVIVAAITFLGGGPRRRVLGYGLVMLAGLLKFFPFTALAWSGGERPRVVAFAAAGLAAVLGLFLWLAGDQVSLWLASIWTVSAATYVFGLKTLGVGAAEMGMIAPGSAVYVWLAATAVLLVVGWNRATRYLAAGVRTAAPETHWRFLILGALVILGAYIGNQNLAYRMILILLVLPGLDALRAVPGLRLGQVAIIGVISMFYFPLRIHVQDLFGLQTQLGILVKVALILLREALWFTFAASLMGLVLAHLRSGPIWQELVARTSRRQPA